MCKIDRLFRRLTIFFQICSWAPDKATNISLSFWLWTWTSWLWTSFSTWTLLLCNPNTARHATIGTSTNTSELRSANDIWREHSRCRRANDVPRTGRCRKFRLSSLLSPFDSFRLATTSERSFERSSGSSGRLDESRLYFGVFQMSRDEIFCAANPGENDQNTLEDSPSRPMWRWGEEVRERVRSFSPSAIKQYIVSLVISHSQNAEAIEREKVYLNKLDIILVQVNPSESEESRCYLAV